MTIHNPKATFVCLVFGNHLNAHSIIHSLISNDVPLKNIWIVKEKGMPPLAAEILNRRVKNWEISIENTAELVEKIHSNFGVDVEKILFFTDEKYLLGLSRLQGIGALANIRFCCGSDKYLDSILDRVLFYRFIEEHQIAPVPKTISGMEKPFFILGKQIVVRPRVSWSTSKGRHQRVSIVSSLEELEKVQNEYRASGLAPEDWCYQEVLSTDAVDNVSVCGWYDSQNQHLYCTRKILQHPDSCGNGDVVEYLPQAPDNIMEQSITLLSALEYEGPLELEWVYDCAAKVYKIIELNPRFWMQHGLVDTISGRIVIRRYLERYRVQTRQLPMRGDICFWVNPLFSLLRMFRGDLRGMGYYYSSSSMSPISLLQAIIYAPFHFISKRSI